MEESFNHLGILADLPLRLERVVPLALLPLPGYHEDDDDREDYNDDDDDIEVYKTFELIYAICVHYKTLG